MPIKEVIKEFLKNQYRGGTVQTYQSVFNKLHERNILNLEMPVNDFLRLNFNKVALKITEMPFSLRTIRLYCSCFTSFAGYLRLHYDSSLPPVVIPRNLAKKCWKSVKTKPVADNETLLRFLQDLRLRDRRAFYIAVMLLQGAKRISEVLEARIENIDFEMNRIIFPQHKSNFLDDRTIITFWQEFMDELRVFLGDRVEGLIFIKKNGYPFDRTLINQAFRNASERLRIRPHISPHRLRATAICSYRKNGETHEAIRLVTGHSTVKQVAHYDQDLEGDNPSSRLVIPVLKSINWDSGIPRYQ